MGFNSVFKGLSEIVESSVQQLTDETVSIITSPMKTNHTSSTTLQEHPTGTRSDYNL